MFTCPHFGSTPSVISSLDPTTVESPESLNEEASKVSAVKGSGSNISSWNLNRVPSNEGTILVGIPLYITYNIFDFGMSIRLPSIINTS